MSRDVIISLEFERDVDFEEIFDRLARAGWEFLRDEDSVWYMVGFDWKDLPLEGLAEARREMRASYEAGETVGVTARLPDGGFFANVMFHEDRASVSLIPLLEYRTFARVPEFVDLGWYVESFLAPCRDLRVVRAEASDQR
ncbi:hypothetical protein [Nonomuraea sp. NPDC003804]|uniref:hypothetical protein n=1 Tax=Nonomuraea sp. NPDC003804 TaxID=3154547 RepID=UPI0033B0F854